MFVSLQAYSLHDREVGYCQGIGFLVGLLLMHVRSNKHRHVSISKDNLSFLKMPEEEAFAVLVSIMQDYTMRELYKPDMFYLGLCLYQFECLIQVDKLKCVYLFDEIKDNLSCS